MGTSVEFRHHHVLLCILLAKENGISHSTNQRYTMYGMWSCWHSSAHTEQSCPVVVVVGTEPSAVEDCTMLVEIVHVSSSSSTRIQ